MPITSVGPIEGAKLIRQGLEDTTDAIPKIGRRQIYLALLRVMTRGKTYPGKRPKKKGLRPYVRTSTLRRGWNLVNLEDQGYELSVEATSPRGHPYEVYVLGDEDGEGQAYMHVGRWPLYRTLVDEELSRLPEVIQSLIVEE